jgi:hypothetical protein
MPTPCSPVRQPPEANAQLEDLVASLLGPVGLDRIVGIVEHQRMQVAVTGVEDVGDAQVVLVANVRDGNQHLAQLAKRNHPIHAVVIGDAAYGTERGLAALPDGRALVRPLADADGLGIELLGYIGDHREQVGDLVVGPFHFDD